MTDAFALFFLFIACYGTMMLVGWAVDKVLRRLIGKGIFPEGYFKW